MRVSKSCGPFGNPALGADWPAGDLGWSLQLWWGSSDRGGPTLAFFFSQQDNKP